MLYYFIALENGFRRQLIYLELKSMKCAVFVYLDENLSIQRNFEMGFFTMLLQKVQVTRRAMPCNTGRLRLRQY